MTVVGITMVRDEADIIATVLRHMATQVDYLYVADNRSVDGTYEIILSLIDEGLPIAVTQDHEVGYMQSEKMTRFAHEANEWVDADWIVPFDADEIWYSSTRRLGDFLETIEEFDIVQANLFDHVCTALDDPNETDPVKRIGWRRNYHAALPKVACRYSPSLIIGMGNHEAWDSSRPVTVAPHRMAIRHFPYRSPDQIIRKIRNGAEAYAATDLPEMYGAHWRGWGRILDERGPDVIVELFRKWHWREHPSETLTVDGEDQEALVKDPATALMSNAAAP